MRYWLLGTDCSPLTINHGLRVVDLSSFDVFKLNGEVTVRSFLMPLGMLSISVYRSHKGFGYAFGIDGMPGEIRA